MAQMTVVEFTQHGEPVQEIRIHSVTDGAEPTRAGRFAPLVVGVVWAGMLAAALLFVWNYGSNAPYWPDEWRYATILTGEQPVTAAWLWEQHFEHRLVVPKLIWVSLLDVTDNDFRAGMYGNVLLLGSMALGLILVARRLRGRTSYTDAFFPLILLNWGHWDNILWAWQIQFISSTVLTGAFLLIIVLSGARLLWPGICLAGTCLVLLPVCGANGLAFVPALSLWLVYAGVLSWLCRCGVAGKRDALLAWAFAVAAVLILYLSFVGYEKPAHHPQGNGIRDTLVMATRFLAASLGPESGLSWWPYSGYGVVGLLLAGAAILALIWLRRPDQRLRAAGLLCFLGGMACLALGIGWGRQEIYSRYVTLAAPALCCAYFVAGLYGGRALGLLVQGSLFVLLVVALPFNFQDGVIWGGKRHEALEAFLQDVRAGKPLYAVAERHGNDVYWHGRSGWQEFASCLAVLQEAGMRPYGSLQRDPAAEKAIESGGLEHPAVVKHIQQEVKRWVPRDAIVLVVSHGVDDLLELDGPVGWHFPQVGGSYTPEKPADSDEAIAWLKKLLGRGPKYIVFPKSTGFWWLEGYPGFKRYLDENCRLVHRDPQCIIYQLSGSRSR
jgi:hypothetical protein